MPVETVLPGREADHACAGREGAGRADLRISEDHAVANRNAEPIGRVQIDVRRWFAAFDMLAAAVDVRTEDIRETKMIEMRANPARRAGRSDRLRKLGRQVADELHGADDRIDTVAEGAD